MEAPKDSSMFLSSPCVYVYIHAYVWMCVGVRVGERSGVRGEKTKKGEGKIDKEAGEERGKRERGG